MPQAIIYIRFSTPKQEHGDSYERQLRDARAHCERNGWPVAEVVEDRGRSAYKGDHLNSGSLGQFTKRVEAGEIPAGTILVVEQLDRLSRQGHQIALSWLQRMCAAGLKISVVHGNRLYDAEGLNENLFDVIEILMKAKLAHDESLNKGRRVAEAWRQKQHAAASSKAVLTQGCPGWLEPAPKGNGELGTNFVVIPERAATIRQIFQWTADGVGLQGVVKKLNAGNYKPWGRMGGGWAPTQILRWIEGPSVEGDYIPFYGNRNKPNGERVVGYYPRIVDADLVARARAGLRSRRGTGGPRYDNGFTNLFVGKFVCAQCRGNMVVKRSAQRRDGRRVGPGYVGCANAALHRECSNRALFRYQEFEAEAVAAMLHLALDDKFFRRSDEITTLALKLADAKKELQDGRERAKRLIDLLARVDAPEIEEEIRGVSAHNRAREAQIAELEKQLDGARGAVSPAEHLQRVISVQNALTSEDPETRNAARLKVHEAIKGVVDFVDCNPADPYGDGIPKKTFTLVLVRGVHAFKFDAAGRLIAEVSVAAGLEDGRTGFLWDDGAPVFANPDVLRTGLTGGDQEHEARLDAYLARRTKAAHGRPK